MPGPAGARARVCFENMSAEEAKSRRRLSRVRNERLETRKTYREFIDDVSCVISEESRVILLEL